MYTEKMLSTSFFPVISTLKTYSIQQWIDSSVIKNVVYDNPSQSVRKLSITLIYLTRESKTICVSCDTFLGSIFGRHINWQRLIWLPAYPSAICRWSIFETVVTGGEMWVVYNNVIHKGSRLSSSKPLWTTSKAGLRPKKI